MVKKYLFVIFFSLCALPIFADTWGAPKITTTYSQNKEYLLKVYPRSYPKNYFTNRYRRQYKKGIVKDTVVLCHAVLYHVCKSDTIEIWSVPLVNFDSPVRVIVANDGKSVVTLDNWGNLGYKHTMVIYGESGELIDDFALEDISPFPLDEYEKSVSSIWWRGGAEYLDNDRIKIYFRNEKQEVKSRIFNIKQRIFE